jgi:hypothetical protein
MKKQINPTIKAHLIRGAFYLLLLLAVCAIPFALAQSRSRGTSKPGVVNPAKFAAAPPSTGAVNPRNLPGRSQIAQRTGGAPHLSSALNGRSPVTAKVTRFLRTLIPNAVYMIDDGTAENSVAWGNGSQNDEALWFNQFDVIPGQTMISTVSVAWGTPNFPDPSMDGTPITIGIWSDPNGDGNPSDAVLLGQVSGTIQNSGTDTFIDYTLSPPVDVSAFTSFFVGDMTPMNNGPEHFFQGIDQDSTLHRQSWIAAMSDGSAVDFVNIGNNDFIFIIDDLGIPGNWLIRADTGAVVSPTPTPTASPSCTPIVVTGSIFDAPPTPNPTQTDKLAQSGIPQTCPATTTCAVFGDPNQFHYDAFTFTNTTNATQCVTIDTNSQCDINHSIFTAAYLGSFDPTNICTNWIGDSGFSPTPTMDSTFQVDIPAGATFVVVVSEVHHAGCPLFTVTITGLCGGASPTPTATPTASPTCTPSGGTIYNIAGFALGIQTTTTRIYDIATNTWTTGAPIPEPNGLSDQATGLSNGKIYIAGGFNGSGAISTLHIYDIASDSWSTGASMPQALFLPGFGVINGKLYIASGNDGINELTTLYIYDIASDTWSNGAPVPQAVTGPGSAVFQGKLYLFGGGFPTPLTITQIYDPGTNTWTTGPSLNFARLWFYGGAIDDSSIVAPGGDNPPGIPLNVNEQFTSSWAVKAALPYNARGPFAVSDGTFVYIGGGFDGSTVHTDTLRFDPVANTYTTLAPAPDPHYLSQAVIVPGSACPTATPTATATAPSATPTATATAPSATPTATATATAPTATPTSTATATAPSATPTATATPTGTVRPTPTPRAQPTPRPAPTQAPRPTIKPISPWPPPTSTP